MKATINEIFDEIKNYDTKIDVNIDITTQLNKVNDTIVFLDLKLEEIEKNLKRLNYKLNKIANENQITPTSKLMLETFHEYFKENE